MAVKIGDTFRSVYADSNPQWRVVRRSGEAVIAVISADEYDYAGIEQAFTIKQVEASKKWARTLSKLGDEQAEFENSLKVGQIVHYHDGFGNYVRCEVVVGTPENVGGVDPAENIGRLVLQPIALVGAWRVYDLPSRDALGNVKLGYHAEKVVNRTGAWMANHTCVFEAPGFVGPRGPNAGVDPRELEAIDLSVPDMTPDEAKAAKAEQLRAEMIARLSDYSVDAKTAMLNAVSLVVK